MQQIKLLYNNTSSRFVESKYDITLSSMGHGEIIFNTGRLQDFSIFVLNESSLPLTGVLKLYPEEGICYTDNYSRQQIDSMQMNLFIGHFISQYTSIFLTGRPYQSAYVYLQGHQISRK